MGTGKEIAQAACQALSPFAKEVAKHGAKAFISLVRAGMPVADAAKETVKGAANAVTNITKK
jgi:hypothetical protein